MSSVFKNLCNLRNLRMASINGWEWPRWILGETAYPPRQLKFVDPGKMMKWIDNANENSTHWEQDGYKDRGVDVRYDVPESGNLDEWRREL